MNEESYKRTFEDIVRNIDRLENDCIPSVSLSQTEVSSLHNSAIDFDILHVYSKAWVSTFLFILFFGKDINTFFSIPFRKMKCIFAKDVYNVTRDLYFK